MENALNRIWCARPCTTAPGMCPRKPLLHGPGPPAALDKGVTGHHRVYALSHSFLHHKEQQEAGMESMAGSHADVITQGQQWSIPAKILAWILPRVAGPWGEQRN